MGKVKQTKVLFFSVHFLILAFLTGTKIINRNDITVCITTSPALCCTGGADCPHNKVGKSLDKHSYLFVYADIVHVGNFGYWFRPVFMCNTCSKVWHARVKVLTLFCLVDSNKESVSQLA